MTVWSSSVEGQCFFFFFLLLEMKYLIICKSIFTCSFGVMMFKQSFWKAFVFSFFLPTTLLATSQTAHLSRCVCVCVCSGETLQTHQSGPPAAGMLQGLSAAGEGSPRQRARAHQPAGGRQAESPPLQQEWVDVHEFVLPTPSLNVCATLESVWFLFFLSPFRLQTCRVEGFSAGCATLRKTTRAADYLREPA